MVWHAVEQYRVLHLEHLLAAGLAHREQSDGGESSGAESGGVGDITGGSTGDSGGDSGGESGSGRVDAIPGAGRG
jgi:hypothetical protein